MSVNIQFTVVYNNTPTNMTEETQTFNTWTAPTDFYHKIANIYSLQRKKGCGDKSKLLNIEITAACAELFR